MQRQPFAEGGVTQRLCPCVENAYLNGTIDLPPSVNEGALPIMGGGNTYEGKF